MIRNVIRTWQSQGQLLEIAWASAVLFQSWAPALGTGFTKNVIGTLVTSGQRNNLFCYLLDSLLFAEFLEPRTRVLI